MSKNQQICGACNGSGGTYREVQERSTGRWTKEWFPCSRCRGKGHL